MTHRIDTHKYGKMQQHHEESKYGDKTYVKSIGLTKKHASNKTRSQAVARIADRTVSQHLWSHLTSSVT